MRSAGVEVRRGHQLTDLAQDDEAVTATVAGPDGTYRLRTRYLVGADGGHSVTRKRSGIAFPGVTRDNTVSRTVNAAPPAGLGRPGHRSAERPRIRADPAAHASPHRDRAVRVRAVPRPPAAVVTLEYGVPDDTAAPLSLAEMEESIRRVLGVDVPLTPPAGDGPYLLRRLTGTNTRLAERFRDRRVLLAGDAAHVHSATGGPGLNLGLQNTVNLGWKLAAAIHDDARDGLLDTYETERRPVGQRVIMHTQAQSALNAPGADVTALRELFGELLTDPRNIWHIAETMAGSDVRYETGGRPLAGRFAPNMVLHTASGPVRLAQLTRDARPLLLDMTKAGLPSDGPWQLVRADARSSQARALLLRPDTYVAWASSAARPDTGEIDALRAAAGRSFDSQ